MIKPSKPSLLGWGQQSQETSEYKRLVALPWEQVLYDPSEKALRGYCYSHVIEKAIQQPINPDGYVICGTTFKFPSWEIPKDIVVPGFDSSDNIKTAEGFWKVWTTAVIPRYKKENALLGRIGRGSRRRWAAKSQDRKFNPISNDPRLGWNGSPKWISARSMELIKNTTAFEQALEAFKDFNLGEDIAFGLLFVPWDTQSVCEIDILKSRKGKAHEAEHRVDVAARERAYAKLGSILDDFYKAVGYKPRTTGEAMLRSRICHGSQR